MPLTSFHSCPGKNGMGATEPGVILYCPLLHSVPRCRAGGALLLLATAETPGFLGNLVSEKGAGGDMLHCEWSSLQAFPAQGHSSPILCFLEIQTKGCFSIFKEKKKKVKTKHSTSQVVTLGPSLSLLFSSLPSFFPYVLSLLALLPPTFLTPYQG